MFLNRDVVQGSGVEPKKPMLYIVMEGALHTLIQINILFKYADDTSGNLLVPAYSDVRLLSEFEHVKQWALTTKWSLILRKLRKLFFYRPSLKHFLAPAPLCGVEQVSNAKLFGSCLKEQP